MYKPLSFRRGVWGEVKAKEEGFGVRQNNEGAWQRSWQRAFSLKTTEILLSYILAYNRLIHCKNLEKPHYIRIPWVKVINKL
jgi:hypothetical protein